MAIKKKQDKPGAPLGNTNAEKWSLETATELFNNMLAISYTGQYDFMPAIFSQLMVTRKQVEHLKKRFTVLQQTYDLFKQRCEVNCYELAKTSKMGQAIFIFNLKANYGWVDKVVNENTNTHTLQDFSVKDLITFKNTKE